MILFLTNLFASSPQPTTTVSPARSNAMELSPQKPISDFNKYVLKVAEDEDKFVCMLNRQEDLDGWRNILLALGKLNNSALDSDAMKRKFKAIGAVEAILARPITTSHLNSEAHSDEQEHAQRQDVNPGEVAANYQAILRAIDQKLQPLTDDDARINDAQRLKAIMDKIEEQKAEIEKLRDVARVLEETKRALGELQAENNRNLGMVVELRRENEAHKNENNPLMQKIGALQSKLERAEQDLQAAQDSLKAKEEQERKQRESAQRQVAQQQQAQGNLFLEYLSEKNILRGVIIAAVCKFMIDYLRLKYRII